MPSALSLWMNNLVSKLFGLCYDSGIVSLSPHLNPCLDMVLVHCLLPAFWKHQANSFAMFYSRLKDQALLRIHLSQISAVYVLVGPPSIPLLCVLIVVKNELRGTYIQFHLYFFNIENNKEGANTVPQITSQNYINSIDSGQGLTSLC